MSLNAPIKTLLFSKPPPPDVLWDRHFRDERVMQAVKCGTGEMLHEMVLRD
jgi:hypothetical protein